MELTRWSRRRVLQSLVLAPAIVTASCSSQTMRLPPQGAIVGPDHLRGHRLRGPRPSTPSGTAGKPVDVVIVGGGIAGLASARELARNGLEEFVLLELEDRVGGTSRGDDGPVSAYPWGAHYLPAPFAANRPLVELLQEMGIVSGYDARGEPIYVEEFLCRDPEERLFADGAWHEELISDAISDAEKADWLRFRAAIDQWVGWRDDQGRRAFAIPSESSSTAPEVLELDRISISEWLDRQGIRTPLTLWQVDYACRDDYGTRADATSAWAGLFYFASRMTERGADAQPFLTWPEGNARIVRHLHAQQSQRIRTGIVVTSIVPHDDFLEVTGWQDGSTSDADGPFVTYRARRVIFAAPQFVAPYVIEGYREARGSLVSQFTYAPWLVANLHLTRRPREVGFPAAWDNVLRDSEGLGYVVATHQSGRDHGPTVWTYYRPICDRSPREGRAMLEQMTWSEGADWVLGDLEQAHPELRSIVERLDWMRWGHAMIRPVPGFRASEARRVCQQPFQGVHFANTDLSGIALLEEAFHHGRRAAQEVAAAFDHRLSLRESSAT